MKKLLALTIVALFVIAATASAQIPSLPSKPFVIQIGGGLSLPQEEDFDTEFGMGYHGLAGIAFNTGPLFSIQLRGEYHFFPLDVDEIDGEDVSNVNGGDFTALMVGANIKVQPKIPMMPIKPYGLVGGGFAINGISDIDELYDFESSTDAYYQFGLGVEFAISPMVFAFIEGRYVIINKSEITINGETEDVENNPSFIPISVGIRF